MATLTKDQFDNALKRFIGVEDSCTWKLEHDGYYAQYKTGCNCSFTISTIFNDPDDFGFCPYCGKALKVADQEGRDDNR